MQEGRCPMKQTSYGVATTSNICNVERSAARRTEGLTTVTGSVLPVDKTEGVGVLSERCPAVDAYKLISLMNY